MQKCILTKYENIRDITNKIMDNLIESRQRKDVEYYPFERCSGVVHKRIMSYMEIDFTKVLTGYKIGDVAYAKTLLLAPQEAEMAINIMGCVKVFFNGNEVGVNTTDELRVIPVLFERGTNELLVKTVYNGKDFGFKVVVSVPIFRGLWAGDYLYSTRATLPIEGYEGQSGFALSKLYKSGESTYEDALQIDSEQDYGCLEFVFPTQTDLSKANILDFNSLCESGTCSYALSWLDGNITIAHTSPIMVFLDGKAIYDAQSGSLNVNGSNTQLMIKSMRNRNDWGFSVTGNGTLSLPFVNGGGKNGLHWLWVGGFGDDKSHLHTPFPPEYNVQFKTPYIGYNNIQTYWKFNKQDVFLRPVLDTFFYGQWFYPLMVGVHGLRVASEKLERQEYIDYFTDYMQVMTEYFDLMNYEVKYFDSPSFLSRATELTELDPIGTIGMNMVDFYTMTNSVLARNILEILSNVAMKKIHRFEDGTYNRGKTMWADDIYMSCPFLVRMGRLTNDAKYYDEVILQIEGFKKRMWIEDKKLFSHIYFLPEQTPNKVPWGRGNGWIYLSLTEILINMPEDYDKRKIVTSLFKEFSEGIKAHIDESGRWHQVLDKPESYLETSCTAMFVTAMARGVKYGWIDKTYAEIAKKGWHALLEDCIDDEGSVHGVCTGSGCSMEAEYYFNLPTRKNDDHGTGIVLLAATEMMDLK